MYIFTTEDAIQKTKGAYVPLLSLELEAILQSCSLVEDEMIRSTVRILVEVTYALKLYRNA